VEDLMTTLAQQAQARARYQSAHGPQFGRGQCMQRCRELVDAPAIGDYDGDGDPDAEDGWKYAKHKHPTNNPAEIPGGCYAWWKGGSNDNWHVAYADPDARGQCWSTDIERTGYFDLVPITLIHQKWGLTLVGWSEDIDGVRVYDAATQEDDMPLTDDDVQKVAKAVIAQMIDVIQPDGSRVPWHMGALLRSIKAGQDATLVEVAKAQGLTPDQLAAIQKAIADAAVDVDVTVHNQTGA
jgi:hypothetical protein